MFQKTTCISKDVLLKYVDGQLSKEALRAVEKHLIDCPLCDTAYEGIQSVGTVEFQKILSNVSSRIQNHQQEDKDAEETDNVIEFRPTVHPPVAVRNTKRFLSFMSIAASIILIAVVAIMFLGGDSASSIADRHFKQLADETARGGAAQSLMEQADAMVKSKDYAGAVAIYDQINTPEANYRAGNSYYAMGKFDLAATKFESVIAAAKDWVEYAEFHLALTYLKLDRIANAKGLLEKIGNNDEHVFSKQAKATLEDVNDL